jgi:hypothetical protein
MSAGVLVLPFRVDLKILQGGPSVSNASATKPSKLYVAHFRFTRLGKTVSHAAPLSTRAQRIERQTAEIRKRLAFLTMIERVLATTVPAAAKKANPRIGNEAGSRNRLKSRNDPIRRVPRIPGNASAIT